MLFRYIFIFFSGLLAALGLLLVGCASAAPPVGTGSTGALTPPPLQGTPLPPVVEILTDGQETQGQISLAPGAVLELEIAASGRDLIYQWDLQGQGHLENVVGYRGIVGLTNRYAAPIPVGDEVIRDTITVTVTDRDNRSATDQITIVVDGQAGPGVPGPTSHPELTPPPDPTLTASPTVTLVPSVVRPTPTPLPENCAFTIVHPQQHAPVPAEFPVWGTATPSCRGSDNFWVTLTTENRQWPQRAPLTLFPNSATGDLGWFANAEIRGPLMDEKVLGIFVLQTTPELDSRFSDWLTRAADLPLLEGFSTADLLEHDAIIVTGISVLGG